MITIEDYNLEIVIGDTFSKVITIYEDKAKTIPKDLTGYSFKCQVKSCRSSQDVILEFISPTTIDISMASIGKIILKASNTSTLALVPDVGFYDIKWIDTLLDVKTFLEGSVSIVDTITK